MHRRMLALSDLERAVLAATEQEPEHSANLHQQIASMSVSERENTGHGFYTRLRVEGAPR